LKAPSLRGFRPPSGSIPGARGAKMSAQRQRTAASAAPRPPSSRR